MRRRRPLSSNLKGDYCAFRDKMGHRTINCRHLRKQLQELVNWEYLKKFIRNPGQPSEVKVQKGAPDTQQLGNLANHALIGYKEVKVIFSTCLLEGTTLKGKSIFNEARRSGLSDSADWSPSILESISFSEVDSYDVHFSHHNALIVTMYVGSWRVSRILIDNGSSV